MWHFLHMDLLTDGDILLNVRFDSRSKLRSYPRASNVCKVESSLGAVVAEEVLGDVIN